MTTLSLSYRQSIRTIQNRVSESFFRLPWKPVYLLGGAAIMAMLIFYVYLVNGLTGGVYMIKNYNKQIDALSQQNINLQDNFDKANFLGTVVDKSKELGFERTTDITYVQIQGQEVSLAKAQ